MAGNQWKPFLAASVRYEQFGIGDGNGSAHVMLQYVASGYVGPEYPPEDHASLLPEIMEKADRDAAITKFTGMRAKIAGLERDADSIERELLRLNVAERDALANESGEGLAGTIARLKGERTELQRRQQAIQETLPLLRAEIPELQKNARYWLASICETTATKYDKSLRTREQVEADIMNAVRPFLEELAATVLKPYHMNPESLTRYASEALLQPTIDWKTLPSQGPGKQ